LEQKLAGLEAERQCIKAFNASCKAGAPDASLLTDKQRAKYVSVARVAPYSLGKQGRYPSYALTNLSGTINTTRKRLDAIKRAGV
jgi:hypothetical protein